MENQQSLSPIQEQRPKPIPRKPSTFTGNSKSNQTAQKAAVIEDLLIEDSVVKGGDDVMKDKAAMSMSKKELLDEMRKEKHQHHRQIRYYFLFYGLVACLLCDHEVVQRTC